MGQVNVLLAAGPLLSASSRWLGGGGGAVGPHSRCDDALLPWDTDGEYGGLCASYYVQDIPRREHVPIVFVHGNTVDASVWLPAMEWFLDRGDTGEDLWAITFRRRSPSHEEMATQLDDFVAEVRAATGHDTVNVVAHSLGVTGVRYWLARRDRYDWVDAVVGLAGANHGSALCRYFSRAGITFGPGRPNWFLNPDNLEDPDHPLAALNRNETPGDVDYYTIRATQDRFFRENPESPALEGAVNEQVATDHRGLLTAEPVFERLSEWLRGS